MISGAGRAKEQVILEQREAIARRCTCNFEVELLTMLSDVISCVLS